MFACWRTMKRKRTRLTREFREHDAEQKRLLRERVEALRRQVAAAKRGHRRSASE
jgi:hypothetical protein